MQTATNTTAQAALAESEFAAPRRILVATDLTDGDYLIPHVVAQARASKAFAGQAEVTLVHAILPAETLAIDAGAMAAIESPTLEAEVHQAMLRFAHQLQSHGVCCNVVAHHGFAAQVIQEEMNTFGATRLIMASHGRGRLGQLLLGSVANQLLGTVNVPVFAVGPRSAAIASHAAPRRILHPVSLLGDSRKCVNFAIATARLFKAELTLLYNPDRDVEASIHPGCTLTWAENLFAALVPDHAELVPKVRVDVTFGNRVDEIRKAAVRTEADWIVLGVEEGLPFWPLMESTAYKVMAVAPCPVLAIRDDRHVREKVHQRARTHSKAAYSAIG